VDVWLCWVASYKLTVPGIVP